MNDLKIIELWLFSRASRKMCLATNVKYVELITLIVDPPIAMIKRRLGVATAKPFLQK